MKFEMLPEENGPIVYAAVTENNEVIWCYDNGNAARQRTADYSFAETSIDQDRALFRVYRRDMIVVVKAVGWYDSDFYFKLELTIEEPNKAVILANMVGDLMEAAYE